MKVKTTYLPKSNMKNNVLLNVRIKQETIAELNKISTVLEVPYSQLVRQAISEKIEELKAKNPEVKKILALQS